MENYRTQKQKLWGHFISLSSTVALLLIAISDVTSAYTVITLSTSAPIGLESSLISSVTSQYQATVTANPFVTGTYAVKVFGVNTNYNPPIKNSDLLNALVGVSTSTFVYGFADGMSYQNNVSIGLAADLSGLCDSATNFLLIQTTTSTFKSTTCRDVLSNLMIQFFNINLSTPTVIPPNGG